MKILSVCHFFPNRVRPHSGIFVKERLKSVAMRENVNLSVVAPVPSFPSMNLIPKYQGLETLEQRETIDGLEVFHPRYFMIPKFFKSLDAKFFESSFTRFLEENPACSKSDIFDFHWTYPDAIGGLESARKFGKKTVVTVRGNEALYYFDKSKMRKVLQQRLSEFDHVIAVSSDLQRKIMSEYNVQPSKISVIPNGIDSGKFYLIDRDESLRICDRGISRQFILTVSRLSGEKGLEFLLKAFSDLNRPDLDLIIIGDGPLKKQLTAMCQSHNIADRVIFKGEMRHDKLLAWYNAADLFCLPSLREGCPNVVIEALACGTPVVASNVGGIPDLVTSDNCGYLVPPADSEALSKALERALAADWNSKVIASVGSARSWEQVAESVIDVFERIL